MDPIRHRLTNKRNARREFGEHAHSFEGVIRALLNDPAGFTIAGFEGSYSKQEQELLRDIQRKLMAAETEREAPIPKGIGRFSGHQKVITRKIPQEKTLQDDMKRYETMR